MLDRVHPGGPVPGDNRGLTLQEVERNAFIQTCLRTGRNNAGTACEPGISERSVYNPAPSQVVRDSTT